MVVIVDMAIVRLWWRIRGGTVVQTSPFVARCLHVQVCLVYVKLIVAP
jgi:hypothetical protein